jgi:hypothetical protein
MKENLKNILTNLSTNMDQETLLLYLQEKLSQEQKHEVEKQLLENEFANDALEGLQQVKNKKDINLIVEQLNRDLKLKTARRKKRREQLRLKEQPWLYISLIIFLILIIISFVVIRQILK